MWCLPPDSMSTHKSKPKKEDSAPEGMKGIPVQVTISPEHRIIFANGYYAGVNQHEGFINLISHVEVPKITKQERLEAEHADFQIVATVKMAPWMWKDLANYMTQKVVELEQQIKKQQKKRRSPTDKPDTPSYVG